MVWIHNLAPLTTNLPDPVYIREPVGIRQEYNAALIYGAQRYQHDTGDPGVFAYNYSCEGEEIVTAVNASDDAYSGPPPFTRTRDPHKMA